MVEYNKEMRIGLSTVKVMFLEDRMIFNKHLVSRGVFGKLYRREFLYSDVTVITELNVGMSLSYADGKEYLLSVPGGGKFLTIFASVCRNASIR